MFAVFELLFYALQALECLGYLFWIATHWRVSLTVLSMAGGIYLASHDYRIVGPIVIIASFALAIWGLIWTLNNTVENLWL